MYQGGVLSIELYENVGVEYFHYDYNDDNKITNLTNQAKKITIENLQRPSFNIDEQLGENGKIVFEYEITFFILGYIRDSQERIEDLAETIHGWVMVVNYYDGTSKFYPTPIFLDKSKIKHQDEASREVTMMTRVPTTQLYLDYVAGQVSLIAYRADTTVLTADTTIYTADYGL